MFELFNKLGLMGYPLAICWVLVVAICFERLFFFFKIRNSKDSRYQSFSQILTKNKTKAKAIRDDLMSIVVAELNQKYQAGIKSLRIIGTISPMLGLLGTMLGIISAFKEIAASSGPVLPNMIAKGLWEAMLTTVIGLIIALIALLMAHFFRALSQKEVGSLCLKLNKLSLSFEIDGEMND